MFLMDQALEKSGNAVDVLDIVYNPMIKVHLFFLKFPLASLNNINAYFQESE